MDVRSLPIVVPKGVSASRFKLSAQLTVEVLRKRAEFLRVRSGKSLRRASCVIQARALDSIDPSRCRYGLTATKKIGNAVVRNRAKRRLRALAIELLPEHGHCGWDYVFIARHCTAQIEHESLRRDVLRAIKKIHES